MGENALADRITPEHDAAELAARWLEPDPSGGGSRREAALRALRAVSAGSTDAIGLNPDERDLRGIDLAGEDLAGLDLSRCDFSGANLSGANLRHANLTGARLSGAHLVMAKLDGCELLNADLSHANLNECSGKRAGFGVTTLTHASFINAQLGEATFVKADLSHADFRAADLHGSRISDADLTEAIFTRANLRGVDLKRSDVKKASFDLTDLREARLMGVTNFTRAHWIGADIRGVDSRGAYMVQRAIRDENYLYEFRTRSKYHAALYWLWWTTSDCGRSLLRWALFVAFITFVFALAYSQVGVEYGEYETPLSSIYFSVVTLTTLGYGDAYPATMAGQILAAVQAVLGYVGLGGLLSILTNKMARRAD